MSLRQFLMFGEVLHEMVAATIAVVVVAVVGVAAAAVVVVVVGAVVILAATVSVIKYFLTRTVNFCCEATKSFFDKQLVCFSPPTNETF